MIITVKELRIGNWVELNGNFCEISGITQTGEILVSAEKTSRFADEVHPISLTEDIIKKCGFQKNEEKNYYKLREGFIGFKFMISSKNIIIDITQYRETTNEVMPGSNWKPLNHVLYLHQLQNLYYDIMGRELEIKF